MDSFTHELNTEIEAEANGLYRKILERAQEEGDVTTAFLIKRILEDVEEHHDRFLTILKEV